MGNGNRIRLGGRNHNHCTEDIICTIQDFIWAQIHGTRLKRFGLPEAGMAANTQNQKKNGNHCSNHTYTMRSSSSIVFYVLLMHCVIYVRLVP